MKLANAKGQLPYTIGLEYAESSTILRPKPSVDNQQPLVENFLDIQDGSYSLQPSDCDQPSWRGPGELTLLTPAK